MRISDLSSDVCSSDLAQGDADVVEALEEALLGGVVEREGHLEADGRRREGPGADVDDDLEGGIRLDGGEELISDLGAHLHRHEAVLRSEEHTSELQSLMRISYAVFCLKKKNK